MPPFVSVLDEMLHELQGQRWRAFQHHFELLPNTVGAVVDVGTLFIPTAWTRTSASTDAGLLRPAALGKDKRRPYGQLCKSVLQGRVIRLGFGVETAKNRLIIAFYVEERETVC